MPVFRGPKDAARRLVVVNYTAFCGLIWIDRRLAPRVRPDDRVGVAVFEHFFVDLARHRSHAILLPDAPGVGARASSPPVRGVSLAEASLRWVCHGRAGSPRSQFVH